MKGKRILSLVLAVLFLLPGLGVGLTASAQDAVTFSVVPDETTAHPGETITYAVHMGPVSNLYGLQITLGIPDGLTFKQANLKTKLLQQMSAECPEFSIGFEDSTLTLLIYTISPSDQFTSTADGVLMTFTCTVDEGASGAKTIDLPKHIVSSRTGGGTVPTAYDPAGSAVTIMPAPPVKAIELVTGGAAANIAGAQKSSVYFGNYKQSSDGGDGYNVDPVKWRVLENTNGKLFLLADQNLDASVYYERYFTVTWETSTIRAWLNGTGEFSEENFKDSAFSAGEDAAVCVTDVSNPDSVFDDRTVPGGNDTADKVFLLSRDEAMNTAYGFTNDIEPTDTRVSINTAYTGSGGSNYGWTVEGGSADYWWLRSPGSADDRAAIVFETGQLNPGGYDVPNRSIAVRPAMNVDLGKVLFTSPAVGGKQGDGLTAVGNYNYYGSEWKLTLLDDSRQFAVTQTASGGSATVTNGYNTGSVTGGTDVQSQPAVTTAPGKTVSFSYNGATVGENEYVSAILTDEDGAALYYGRLAQPTDEEGTVDVTIPADLAPGDYTLMLFSEQCNGDKKTDLASAPINVALTVKARVPGDANKDGQLDMADVLAILYYLSRIGEPEIDVQDADVNGNSEIDGGDAEMIQEYLAGQIDSLNGQKPDRPTGNNHVTENPEVTCAFTDADGSSEVTVNAGEKTTIPVTLRLYGSNIKLYALDMQFKCSDGIRITGFIEEEEGIYEKAHVVTNDSTLRANAFTTRGINVSQGPKTFKLMVEVPADATAGSTYTVDFDDLCQVFKFNKKGARELFTTAVIPLTINIKADPSKKAIRLVPNSAADYILGAQESSVWFGNYKQSSDGADGFNVDPVKWRVLSNADGKLFLLADQNLDVVRYNEEGTSVTWATCTLRAWMNGYDGNPYGDSFIGSAFSDKETAAIAQTAVVNDDNPSYGTPGGDDTTDKVFLLSIAEAKNTAYGFTDNYDDTDARVSRNTAYVASGGHTGDDMYAVGEYDVWWLRSPGGDDPLSSVVSRDGYLNDGGILVDFQFAVRPALNVDLGKVLFTSAAENGKQGDGLTAVGGYTGSDWKLTVLDDSRSDFTAKCTKIENGVYTVQYSGATTGTNEKISAMIVDEDGIVTYYGVLEAAKAGENTLTLDVNGKLNDGDTLYVFNEQVNGDKKTDYASALVDVTEKTLTSYDLWVGGVQFDEDNLEINANDIPGVTGSATYDPENNELTLDGFQYTGEGYRYLVDPGTQNEQYYAAGIYYTGTDELTVRLVQENAVTVTGDATNSYGFRSENLRTAVTFTGTGSLTARGADNAQSISYGITVSGSLCVEKQATVTGVGGDSSKSSYGVTTYVLHTKLEVYGTLTGNGGSASNISCGVYGAEITVGTDAVLTAAGSAGNSSRGIIADSVTVRSGTVEAASGEGRRSLAFSNNNTAFDLSDDLTMRAGESKDKNEVVTGDGWKNQKYVLIEVFRYKAGDTLQYGTYPQSEVTDAATVAALNAKLRSNGWISYGYYIGTGGSNGEMAPDDFMRYQDVVLDGVKYRAVTFDSYRPILTKNVSSAFNSLQDENGYEPGSTYWFQFEPVTWKVLDPDSGLVLCCSAIDAQAYHNYIIFEFNNEEYWGDAEQKHIANDYAHSSIRAWLNEDFINTAFSAAQQENIKVSELDNSLANSGSDTYVYASTSDKIFLPSVSDVTAYGFDSDRNAQDEARRRAPSDYAKCQGIMENTTKTAFWWLRASFGSYGDQVLTVTGLGDGSSNTSTISTAIGVVPALRMQELQDDPTGAPLKVTPEMTLTAEPVIYGEDAVITAALPANATGSVTFTLTGSSNNYSFTNDSITDGVAQITQKLNADTYAVTAAYSGDAAYEPTSAKTTLTVNPATPEITMTAKSMNDAGTGYEITVTKPADSTQGVMVYAIYSGLPAFVLGIGNDKFENGSYTFRFPDAFKDFLSDNVSGEFELSAVYDGRNDQNYQDNIVELAITLGCAHVWNTPTWDWTDVDNPTYSTTCTLCADGQTSGSVSSTKGERVAATVEKNAYTPYSASVELSGHTYTGTFELEEPGTMLAARKAAFDQYKADQKQAADAMAKTGDSAACAALIDAAKSAIDGVTYDESKSLDENKAAVDAAANLDQLAADLTDRRAADEVEKKINDIGNVALTDESKQKIDDAREAYDNLTDKQKALVGNKDTLETAEDAYQLLEDKDSFEQYKDELKQAAEDKRKDDDSDESKKLIDDTVAAIDAMEYDESKSLDENKAAVDDAAKLDDLAADLTDRRAADEVEKKINDIGTVALTDESKQKIDDAREAYDNLTDKQKALVDNKDTLETSEEAYQLLEDKDNFEKYKDELKQAAEDKRRDGDSNESKKLIDDAIAAIDAMVYDESKSLDENKAAVDTAADLDKLTEQLEEHREIHYAVFMADGKEVARVPFTIDTKAITAPAVPVKGGYTGAWPNYELKAGGVEINAVYIKNGALVITDNAKEQGADRVLTFKETVTFTTDTSALPEGAKLCWYVNGEAVTAEKSVTVEAPKDDYTVQVKAFAKDGTLYTESEVLTVKVDHSFRAKLVYFFNLAFGPVTDALKKIVPSFFSFLAALIKAIATALVAVVKSVI